jgi:lipid II:glycine glycyltransferase (peptidoglycan interpeptide bridge formation enzyme)
MQAALERAGRQPSLQLQIKAQGPDLGGLVDGLFCRPWRNTYLLTLPPSSEGPFRIADPEVRAKIRWAVNKATKHGVVVRPAETIPQLREWYGLYLDTMRRNAIPPRSYRFFVALWEMLKPMGMLQLLIAERRDGTKTNIIAGSIYLMFGHTVSYAFNASRSSHLSLQPNDNIQWRALNEACAGNYRYFDLGEVPEDRPTLASSKSKWGAKPIRMYRYCSEAPDGLHSGDYSRSRAATLAQAIWRRLPVKVTELLGNRIYSCL